MQIRTRISLLSILIFAIVCASIVFAAIKREQLFLQQFSGQAISDQQILWKKITDELITRMEERKWIMTENRSLVQALEQGNQPEIAQIGARITKQLENEGVADRFEIILSDGTLAYTSNLSVFQSAVINNLTFDKAIKSATPVKGIGNDKQRNTALVYASPLYSDDGRVMALGIFASDIVNALIELEQVNKTSAMIVNRRGRLLAATSGDMWQKFGANIDLSNMSVLQTIAENDRYFSVSVLPQTADLGGLVGRLVNIKDVTDLVEKQRQISVVTAVIVVGFLIAALLGMYMYISLVFTPLTEGVNVLNALSKGNLQVQIEHSAISKDEVGKIANAVNVFRESMLTFNRFRRSRARQRARQERFIYNEMQSLINTLDGEEREELTSDLEDLGNMMKKNAEQDAQFNDMSSDLDYSNRDSESLAMMATAFHSMSNRVQDQHQRLRDALATKETLIALRSELDIATRVQLSLLPGTMRTTDLFDIYGGMWPAKEVGGDFFDFFRLHGNRIAVSIADVSGKGVPAALFTVMSRTLLRSTVSYINSPSTALENINNFLSENNDANLFITMFYGILDERTGDFTYSNGGHNPPVIRDSKGARPIDTTDGLVLAMFENIDYSNTTINLEPGSRIVMFTDGIPEAFNAEEEAFGDERLLKVVESLPDGNSPEEDVRQIIDAVEDFVQDAPQFDDIACVVLRYNGTGPNTVMPSDDKNDMRKTEKLLLNLTMKPDRNAIPTSSQEIEVLGANYNWPSEWIQNVNLALDELITNIVSYGFPKNTAKKDIKLTVTQLENESVKIELIDEGVEFNPFKEAKEPDVEASVEERKIGGLGIFFVKNLIDETYYERRDGKNHITLVLHAQP